MSSLPNTEIILQILLSVGIIVIAAKFLGTQVKKIGFPVVAGQIVAGLLLRFLPFFPFMAHRRYVKLSPTGSAFKKTVSHFKKRPPDRRRL